MNVNAWVWAAVFHCRDKPITEAADYHSATAVQVAAFGAALSRVLQLGPAASASTLLPLAAGYAHHIYTLSVSSKAGTAFLLCSHQSCAV
eukprot:SAG22_NODE_5469_length_1008_cov_1.246425_1_plen_90_part_00